MRYTVWLMLIFAFSAKQVFCQGPTPGRRAKVAVNISLHHGTVASVHDIWITINLTNNSQSIEKILFIYPKLTTGGPWNTSATVTDVATGKSVLRYQNRAILGSQIYTEDQLKDKYVLLSLGQSLRASYGLLDLVVLKSEDDELKPGKYELQLFYDDNPSNKITFVIKK